MQNISEVRWTASKLLALSGIIVGSVSYLALPTQADDSSVGTQKPIVSNKKSPDMTNYMSLVKRKIQNVWRSPDVQRNCTVTVLFSLDKNGTLVSNSIKSSSGLPNIDQAALQAIKKSAPFAKLPDGAGKFSVEYSFECGPRKSADAYLFNGVPIKNQEYKMSSGGATLRNLDTDSAAERQLQQRAAALQDKTESLESRLSELQKGSPVDNNKIASVSLELANTYKKLQQYDKSESLYKTVVALQEKSDNQKSLAETLASLANLYYVMGKYVDAEPLYERSLSLRHGSPADKQLLTEYAKTLYKLNKTSKADDIYKQLRTMQ